MGMGMGMKIRYMLLSLLTGQNKRPECISFPTGPNTVST